MKKIFKTILLFLIVFTTAGTSFSAAVVQKDTNNQVPEAKELLINGKKIIVPDFVETNDITNIDDIRSISAENEFDLTTLETQTKVIELPNGEFGSLTISPTVSRDSRASTNISNGTSYFDVYWYGGVINFGYKIIVSNPSSGATTITSYYNEWYTTIGASVSGESFTRSSDRTKVVYKLNVNQTSFISYTYKLNASVSGNTLTTSVTF
ncbi:MAG: DUF5626 family protein [Mycoplasmatales bacterium]